MSDQKNCASTNCTQTVQCDRCQYCVSHCSCQKCGKCQTWFQWTEWSCPADKDSECEYCINCCIHRCKSQNCKELGECTACFELEFCPLHCSCNK